MQYPQKNLFPSDTLVPGTWQGIPAALNKGTYETNTFRAAPNPVRLTPGTYTLSSKFPLGAGVQTFVDSVNIILSSSAQLPQTFTVSYEADVYFHFRKNDGTPWSLSDSPVELGIQLEAGTVVTPFQPYELGMKSATAMKKRLNQQVINSDTTGTGGHKYAVGNVMYVKKDIKLNDSQIIVSTAGSFNVAVHEWQDGVGVVGQPIWKKDTYFDVGTYTYSFGGLILREGKKYWFGRYDETGAANVGRTIGLGTVDYKTISTFGGARFTDSDIAFGTTYYYFYSLEVEDLDMRISTSYAGGMKPAILYPNNGQQGMKPL